MNRIQITICLFFLFFIGSSASSQPLPNHPGLEMCRQGKYPESILPLENAKKESFFKNDAEVWNCLALAYLQKNDLKSAQKNSDKAVKLAPTNPIYLSNSAYLYLLLRKYSKARDVANESIKLDNSNLNAYYVRGTANLGDSKFDAALADANKAIEIDPMFPQGYVLKSDVLVAKLSRRVESGSSVKSEIGFLKDATDTLKTGKERCKDKPNSNMLDDIYDSTLAFYEYFSREKSEPTSDPIVPDPNVTPLKILSKPKPSYTNSARQSNTQGTIKMAVLFGANGKIQFTLLLSRLSDGLDEQAIIAARKIQFEPMKRDGKAVSVVRILEYSFAIY